MAEIIKNSEDVQPAGYSPKKPYILQMAEEFCEGQKDFSSNSGRISYIIEDVLPTNEPWLGCCTFLKAFTSLLLKVDNRYYLENAPLCMEETNNMGDCQQCGKCCGGDAMLIHREKTYRRYLSVAGTGLCNAFDPDMQINKDNHLALVSDGNINQSYYMLDGYAERTLAYAGYAYTKVENTGDNKREMMQFIADSVDREIPVMVFLTDRGHSWQLITGYDWDKDVLYLCKEDEKGSEEFSEWYDGRKIQFILPVTGQLEKRLGLAAILKEDSNILEQASYHGIPSGPAAYEKCLSFLADDAYFAAVDEERLKRHYESLHDYLGYHAEARGFAGEGIRLLAMYEEMHQDIKQELIQWGETVSQHAKIAWDGWNAMKPWPYNVVENAPLLRDKEVREVIMDSVRRMAQNDREVAAGLKKCAESL